MWETKTMTVTNTVKQTMYLRLVHEANLFIINSAWFLKNTNSMIYRVMNTKGGNGLRVDNGYGDILFFSSDRSDDKLIAIYVDARKGKMVQFNFDDIQYAMSAIAYVLDLNKVQHDYNMNSFRKNNIHIYSNYGNINLNKWKSYELDEESRNVIKNPSFKIDYFSLMDSMKPQSKDRLTIEYSLPILRHKFTYEKEKISLCTVSYCVKNTYGIKIFLNVNDKIKKNDECLHITDISDANIFNNLRSWINTLCTVKNCHSLTMLENAQNTQSYNDFVELYTIMMSNKRIHFNANEFVYTHDNLKTIKITGNWTNHCNDKINIVNTFSDDIDYDVIISGDDNINVTIKDDNICHLYNVNAKIIKHVLPYIPKDISVEIKFHDNLCDVKFGKGKGIVIQDIPVYNVNGILELTTFKDKDSNRLINIKKERGIVRKFNSFMMNHTYKFDYTDITPIR